MIKNNVGDLVYLPRAQIEAYQGEFKKEKPDLIDKLALEIQTHGFNAPVFIWANHPSKKPALLDGHQRLKALEKLASKGLYLPDDKLPVVSIFAKDDAEAWQKIIEYNSQYSEIDNSVMIEMIGTYSVDMVNIPIELSTSELEKEMIDKYSEGSGTEVDIDNLDGDGEIKISLKGEDYVYAMRRLKEIGADEGLESDGDVLLFLLREYGE